MFVKIAKTMDILPGGMKAYEVDGKEIVICNSNGEFLAFDRRCGHMSAPLDMGTAIDHIITCPLHNIQFDARTGEAIGPMVPQSPSIMGEPQGIDNFGVWLGALMEHVKTCDISTYPVKVEGDEISIDV